MSRHAHPQRRARGPSRISAGAALALSAGLCAPAHARAVINASWLGGNGDWATAALWSPSGAPNNGANTYNVTIGTFGTVTNTAARTISSLVLSDSSAVLDEQSNGITVLGALNLNAGRIQTNFSTMDINGGMTIGGAGVLSGGGSWDISGGSLINSGVIRAQNFGGLTFTSNGGAGVGIWDLDGNGNGRLEANDGDLTFVGTTTGTQACQIEIGQSHSVNVTGGLTCTGNISMHGGISGATLQTSNGALSIGGNLSISGKATLAASGGVTLSSASHVSFFDPSNSLTLSGGTTTLNGVTLTGAGGGTLAFDANSTTSGTTALTFSTVNLNMGGLHTHTVNAGASLTINADRIDGNLGGSGGSFGGVLTNSGTLAVNITGANVWTLDGSLNMNSGSVLNGTPIFFNGTVGVDQTATINAPFRFGAGAHITLNNALDDLRFTGGGNFNGTTIAAGTGIFRLDGAWTIDGVTTINSSVDLDGLVEGVGSLTINPGASLTVSSDQSTDSYGDTLLLDGGALSVTHANGWSIGSTATLQLQNNGGNLASLNVPGSFRINAPLQALQGVAGGSNLIALNQPIIFGQNSSIAIASGVTFAPRGGGTFQGGPTTGAGTFAPDGNWQFNEPTTWSPGALDWGGISGGDTFNLATAFGTLTINSTLLSPMTDNVTITDSTLHANLQPGWVLASGAKLFFNDTAFSGTPIMNGSAFVANGTLQATGTGILNARVTLGPTTTISLFAPGDTLQLRGGSSWNGGNFNYAGLLAFDGATNINANTTFFSRVNWNGASTNAADVFTVASGVTATIAGDQSAFPLTDSMLLDGGTLNAINGTGWTLGAGGVLTMRQAGANNATVAGSPVTIGGAVAVTSGVATISSRSTWSAGSTASLTNGATLRLTNQTNTSNGMTTSGFGSLILEGDWAVNGNTSWATLSIDLDGAAEAGSITVGPGVTLTVAGFLTDTYDRTLRLNDATAIFNSAGSFTLGAGGEIQLNDTAAAGTSLLGGSATINLNGALRCTGSNTVSSRVLFDATPGIIMAAANDRLSLAGDTTFGGGTIFQAGVLALDGDTTVLFGTTFASRLDWDGAVDGDHTFTVSLGTTTTIASDQSADPFGDNLTLNASTLLVTHANGMKLAGPGTLRLIHSGATGAQLTVTGPLSEISNTIVSQGGGANTITAASLRFLNATVSTAAAADNLVLEGASLEFAAGGTYTGPGTLTLKTPTINVTGDTTIAMTSLDWDGPTGVNTTAISAGKTFTLGVGTINAGNNHFSGMVNNSGTLVIDTAANDWTIAAASHVNLLTAASRLEGDKVINLGTLGGLGTIGVAGLDQRGALTLGAGMSSVQNTAEFKAGGSTTLSTSADLHLRGPSYVDAGHTLSGPGRITVDSGSTLSGFGTASVLLANNGVVTPGNSVGTLTVGAYTQGATGSLGIEIGGELAAGADKLTITGAASLAGALNLSLVSGFVPDWGDSWTIATYASRTGDFSSFNLPVLGSNRFWWRAAGATTYTVGVRTAADTNHDGVVDFFDLNNVLSTYNQSLAGTPGSPGLLGDCNEDGVVNFFDLNFVLSLYNQHASLAVPAPGVGSLALLGLSLASGRRRRAVA